MNEAMNRHHELHDLSPDELTVLEGGDAASYNLGYTVMSALIAAWNAFAEAAGKVDIRPS